MSQSAEKVIDHFELFRGAEYTAMLANKKCMFENSVPAEELARVGEWTKSQEYREKNFAREALSINPAKACQPLGAVFAALGFEGTLPFVHGSQGCVAYYRSHFSRHFKEPTVCRLFVDDRRRGCIGRACQHDRWAGQFVQSLQAQDDCRLDNLHGRGHRRRSELLHQEFEGKGIRAARV